MSPLDNGNRSKATATHATSAVATISGVTGRTLYITDISGSSDKAGSHIFLKDGTTVVWQDIVGVGNYRYNFLTPIPGTAGASMSVTVDGTAEANANVSGVLL